MQQPVLCRMPIGALTSAHSSVRSTLTRLGAQTDATDLGFMPPDA